MGCISLQSNLSAAMVIRSSSRATTIACSRRPARLAFRSYRFSRELVTAQSRARRSFPGPDAHRIAAAAQILLSAVAQAVEDRRGFITVRGIDRMDNGIGSDQRRR